MTAALASASLAHVACHGVVRADNPIFSSLLVSDGHLSVHELDRRGIAPHRMILAACESGSEGVFPGNETLGFVSTLLALGTAGLLASSVVVPDWNVVGLMTALHSSLCAGASLPVALARGAGHARSPRPGDVRQLVRVRRLRRGVTGPDPGRMRP